jgi:hypothetical protein
MYQVYILAQTLSKVEWNRFTREVQKGILCQHADTQAFVAALAPHYPAFEVEDTIVFKRVYPDQDFSDARLRVLRTYLKDLLEEFLVQDMLRQKATLREQLLVSALFARNCVPPAKKLLESRLARLDTDDLSMEGLQARFEFEEMGLELYVRENNRSEGYAWMPLINHLTDYALTHRLRFLCAMKNESNFLAIDSQDFRAHCDMALLEVAHLGASANPLVEVYAQLLQLFTQPDFAPHFAAVKAWITRHGAHASATERLNIIGLWVNFLTQGDRRGLPGCVRMTLEAYQGLVAQNLFYQAGSFSVNSARNALSAAVRLGELAWAKAFLAQAVQQLPAAEASRLHAFGAAYLAFAAGHYSQSQKLLARADYSDPFYKLTQTLLLLRITYERGDDDLFLSTHASLSRQMFRKEKVTIAFREGIRNFLKMALALHQCRSLGAPAEAVKALRRKYEGSALMGLREWVLAKMGELG